MTPDDFDLLFDAFAEAARAWQEPDYAPRAAAVAATLQADNPFTEEAVAFAVNQQMHALTAEGLRAWIGARQARAAQTVGVLNAGNVPLVGLQDLLAVVLTGHRYVGSVSSRSPALLPAFADEVRRHAAGLPIRFAPAEAVFAEADALIATGTDETRRWAEEEARRHGLAPARCLLRGHRYAVAVLDGHESGQERDDLAEDVLLHEGHGCRNVALIWAPEGLAPDAYLDSFAAFRGVFPAHPSTPAGLKMQQAFLEAVGLPHASGEGLEFLVSKAEPEVQRPGHVRWSAYGDLGEVNRWVEAHAQSLQLVVARDGVARRLTGAVPVAPPGEAQRPALDWCPDQQDTVAFLAGLS